MNQTCGMMAADQQSGCIRDCMSTGTEDAVSQQVAILFCASNACATETTAQGQQACLRAALQPGACADPVSICMGSSEVCTPDCTDKACGDDGCGGSCGTCAEGEAATRASARLRPARLSVETRSAVTMAAVAPVVHAPRASCNAGLCRPTPQRRSVTPPTLVAPRPTSTRVT